MNTPVTVVGGGLLGMLTARELHLAGEAVVIVERGETGRESSWAGGGILSPLYPWRYPEPVSALAAWGQRHYPEVCAELAEVSGVDPEWTRSGLLMPAVADVAEALAWGEAHGVAMRALERPELLTAEPAYGGQARQGVLMPEVAQVRNPRLVKALHGWLEARSVRFETHTEVHEIAERGGRVVALHTSKGELPTERVVVAGGAWSARMLHGLGPPLEVHPVRGQMIVFRAEAGTLRRILLEDDRYLIPRRDGRILTGSTLEYAGFDKVTTEEALASLRDAAHRLVPALRDSEVEHHWAGLRPGTHSGIPYVAAHPEVAGLYVNAGHFRNGVVLGLASARLTADLVLERTPILDPQPYAFAAAH